MTSTHKIKLKPKAYGDLDSIYLYSYYNFGRSKAIDYIYDINQAFIKISKKLANIQPCDYIKPHLQKLNINSHVIFFNTHDNLVEVIRLLHQSQDFQKHFNN